MCDKAVDDSLGALLITALYAELYYIQHYKIIRNWFITSKMIKELFMLFRLILYDNKNILYFNEDSGNAVFSCIEMGILNIDLGNINLDNNFDEEDPDTITLIRILAWHIKFEKRKAFKKTIIVELMPIARHPKRW